MLQSNRFIMLANEKKKTIKANSLEQDKYYPADIYIDDDFLLLPHAIETPEYLPKLLMDWNISSLITVSPNDDTEESETETIYKIAQNPVSQHEIEQEIASSRKIYKIYSSILKDLKTTFQNFQYEKTFSKARLFELVHKLISTMKQHKSHILRFQIYSFYTTLPDYWIEHALKTAVLVIEYGLAVHFPYYRLVDVAIAALLHTLGLFQLPTKVYTSEENIVQASKILQATPIMTCRMLQNLNFSVSICDAVLHAKEYIDGSGYPQGLQKDKISTEGKIVAVCSKYIEFISEVVPNAPRINNQNAIQSLFKLMNKQLDETVIKTIIKRLTVFPAGSIVKLSNGTLALVLDVNYNDPYKSIIRVLSLGNNTDKLIESTLILDLSLENLSIAQEISHSQASPLYKMLRQELSENNPQS